MSCGFVIASEARQSRYFCGAPRWIATAYGLAMTRECVCRCFFGSFMIGWQFRRLA